jgi:deazaflavin-dependent oxidoreductase (nitroreductase family)
MGTEPPSVLEAPQRRRRARHRFLWNIVNPPTRRLAGFAPWWVLLETKGRRTGTPRTTPLARGPVDGGVVWLSSVHGRHAHWVRNLEATPEVRIKLSGRWHRAHATVHEYDEAMARRFNAYARSGPRTLGIDPVLVRVDLRPRRLVELAAWYERQGAAAELG